MFTTSDGVSRRTQAPTPRREREGDGLNPVTARDSGIRKDYRVSRKTGKPALRRFEAPFEVVN